MLNSGKKFGLLATKKINILTLVLSEKIFLNETKNHNPPSPPFKLNGRSLSNPSVIFFAQVHSISEYIKTSYHSHLYSN